MFYNATRSLAATNAMSGVSTLYCSMGWALDRGGGYLLTFFSPQIIIFMDAFSAVTIMASASRQMVHPAASIVLRPPPLGDHELMNVFYFSRSMHSRVIKARHTRTGYLAYVF